jgi:LPXTG-motif cell wall-anchored protein
MSLAVRRTAPVAVFLACALAAPAARAQDTGMPPLTSKPPVPLSGDATPTPTPTVTAGPTATVTPVATATPVRPELPRTGADAGLTALAGLSLLGMGLGIRRLLADGSL